MRPPRSLRLAAYLEHIVEANARIRSYTAGLSEAEFLQSPITQDAVIRNLEIVGEACHNVLRHYSAFAASHAEIPWRSPYEMRNALTHGYFGVDLVSTWATVVNDLPGFAARIRELLPALR
jgi:uncharacterized protein with HEPN domain